MNNSQEEALKRHFVRLAIKRQMRSGSSKGDIAERLAKVITDLRLDNPYGGAAHKENRAWAVGFSKPGTVDGVVRVFGPRFIQVKYQTSFRDLPRRDSRVFLSEADAANFLELAFVRLRFEDALNIKTK